MRKAEATDTACSIDGCTETTPRRENDNYARAKGWHIWPGQDGGTGQGYLALCPLHAGNQKRQPTPVNLEGQEPLF